MEVVQTQLQHTQHVALERTLLLVVQAQDNATLVEMATYVQPRDYLIGINAKLVTLVRMRFIVGHALKENTVLTDIMSIIVLLELIHQEDNQHALVVHHQQSVMPSDMLTVPKDFIIVQEIVLYVQLVLSVKLMLELHVQLVHIKAL